jgi:hypothetical protein
MEISLESSMKAFEMQTRERSKIASCGTDRVVGLPTRPFGTRAWLAALLVSGLLLTASSSQALSVDLSGIPTGTTNLDVEGFSLTVQSRSYGFVPLEQLSITFNDGPVSLNSVDVLFANSRGLVLANLMGDFSVITAREPGVVSIDAGGIQGSQLGTLAFGQGVQIQRIDFDIVVVGGVDVRPTPTSPIPEPGAALLFSSGLVLVAIRQRAVARSSAITATA